LSAKLKVFTCWWTRK